MVRWMSRFGLCWIGWSFAVAANAGVADPVPLIDGTIRAKHVFTIPGVTASTTLGTVVMCTSLEKTKDVAIAVEVFDVAGVVKNDITQGILFFDGAIPAVAPGRTVTFSIGSTGNHASIVSDESIVVGTVRQGSARVVASSPKIACSAGIVERFSDPPAAMMDLNVVAKTKQKGD